MKERNDLRLDTPNESDRWRGRRFGLMSERQSPFANDRGERDTGNLGTNEGQLRLQHHVRREERRTVKVSSRDAATVPAKTLVVPSAQQSDATCWPPCCVASPTFPSWKCSTEDETTDESTCETTIGGRSSLNCTSSLLKTSSDDLEVGGAVRESWKGTGCPMSVASCQKTSRQSTVASRDSQFDRWKDRAEQERTQWRDLRHADRDQPLLR